MTHEPLAARSERPSPGAREARRVQVAGVRVTYETASGQSAQGDALNIGKDGIFVKAATPLAIGKRIAFEIHFVGEANPITAIGRVEWTRALGEGDGRPAGMGVKFIDLDEASTAVLARVVDSADRAAGIDVW